MKKKKEEEVDSIKQRCESFYSSVPPFNSNFSKTITSLNELLINDVTLSLEEETDLLTELLSALFDVHKKEKNEDLFIRNVKERELKTEIVSLFYLKRRQSSLRIGEKLEALKGVPLSNVLDKEDSPVYFMLDKEGVTKKKIIDAVIDNYGTNIELSSPYIDGEQDYNDEIHSLLVQLMPSLPTILFLVFPLDYCLIFTFSLLFPALLLSNHFSSETSSLKSKGNKKGSFFDDRQDAVLFNQLSLKKGSFIYRFIENTRQRRLYKHLLKEDGLIKEDAFLPFKVDQQCSLAYYNDDKVLTHIDIVYQENTRLYRICDKLSKGIKEEGDTIEICLVANDDKSLFSRRLEVPKSTITFTSEKPTVVRRYYIDRLHAESSSKVSTVLHGNGHDDTVIDHWKTNIKGDDFHTGENRMDSIIETTLYSDDNDVLEDDREYNRLRRHYALRFSFKGYYTLFNINHFFFSNRSVTKYITIRNVHSTTLNDIQAGGDRSSEREQHEKIGYEHGSVLRLTEGMSAKALKDLSVEEIISITKDVDVIDSNTRMELLAFVVRDTGDPTGGDEKNVIDLYSPLLFHIHKEYLKCQGSIMKSVSSKYDYTPYGDHGLKVVITGTASLRTEILLSIFPLHDFTRERMIITTYSKDIKWAMKVERGPFQDEKGKGKAYYNNYLTTKAMFFKGDNDGDDCLKVMLSSQHLTTDAVRLDGRLSNSLYFSPKYDNLFAIGAFEDLQKEINISNLTIRVVRRIKPQGFQFVPPIIKITPSLTPLIHFVISGDKERRSIYLMNETLGKGSSFSVDFIVNNHQHQDYIENGEVDRFTMTFKDLKKRIDVIHFIYNNKRDTLEYNEKEESMTVFTTEPKLKSLMKGDSAYVIKPNSLVLVS